MGRKAYTIEQRLSSLEQRYERLYARYYARVIRKDRQNTRRQYERVRDTMYRLTPQLARYKGLLSRLSATLAHRPKGRITVYLTPAENVKFRGWLKNDFRSSAR